MDVLGVELPEPLADFYRQVEALYAADGVALTCERDDGPAFGGFYLDDGRATVAIRHDLPPEAVCHTLAHELTHGLQRREGWPRALANPDLGDPTAAAELASMLQAIVQCAAAELRIAPLGLDSSWETSERHRTIRYLLRAPQSDADQRGSPGWAYWSLLYAYVSLLHPPERSRTLLHNIARAIPLAAEAGQAAAEAVRRHGYATKEQALEALRAAHDILGFGSEIVIAE